MAVQHVLDDPGIYCGRNFLPLLLGLLLRFMWAAFGTSALDRLKEGRSCVPLMAACPAGHSLAIARINWNRRPSKPFGLSDVLDALLGPSLPRPGASRAADSSCHSVGRRRELCTTFEALGASRILGSLYRFQPLELRTRRPALPLLLSDSLHPAKANPLIRSLHSGNRRLSRASSAGTQVILLALN